MAIFISFVSRGVGNTENEMADVGESEYGSISVVGAGEIGDAAHDDRTTHTKNMENMRIICCITFSAFNIPISYCGVLLKPESTGSGSGFGGGGGGGVNIIVAPFVLVNSFHV